MIRFIGNSAPSSASHEEGMKATLMLEAAYRSARKGEVVKFEEDEFESR
jgi:hypothetical protein